MNWENSGSAVTVSIVSTLVAAHLETDQVHHETFKLKKTNLFDKSSNIETDHKDVRHSMNDIAYGMAATHKPHVIAEERIGGDLGEELLTDHQPLEDLHANNAKRKDAQISNVTVEALKPKNKKFTTARTNLKSQSAKTSSDVQDSPDEVMDIDSGDTEPKTNGKETAMADMQK